MTDYDRSVLRQYNLSTPFPEEWPAGRDDSDVSDDDSKPTGITANPVRRSKSRYSALERLGERRSFNPDAGRTPNSAEQFIPKDEPDPLGSTDSVVRLLRQRGLPVGDDARLRGYSGEWDTAV